MMNSARRRKNPRQEVEQVPEEAYVKTAEVAKSLSMTGIQLQHLARKGIIPCIRIGNTKGRGNYRFKITEVVKALKAYHAAPKE